MNSEVKARITPPSVNESDSRPLIVIGNGPVGIHFTNSLLRKGFTGSIRIFGEEPYSPYNRVQLSALLNRDINLPQLQNPISVATIQVEEICSRIITIDAAGKRVEDASGQWHPFDKLVIATGSRAHVPDIPGRDMHGTYCFRNMRDVESLYARLSRTRHTVVIGGGLLGLETAKAMTRHSTRVTIIQHSSRLMNRQLDEEASHRLQRFAEQAGITCLLNQKVKAVNGDDRVASVTLGDGSILDCDTLIFATGIVPNTELALEARISIGTGIRVNQKLQTSAPDIYAIGECADFNGQVFGLVAPGLEQASVLAGNLCGGQHEYHGSTLITELKVLGLDVFSMGRVSDEYEQQVDRSWVYETSSLYRRILLHKGRIVGAIAIGHWDESKVIRQLIDERRHLWPWHRWRFRARGTVMSPQAGGFEALPASTIICNCQQVSLGNIRQCLAEHPATLPQLQTRLGAGLVCGSCKPLLQQLLQQPVEKQALKTGLLVSATVSVILATLLLVLPAFPAASSVQEPGWDRFWTDSFLKQVSGFTILGLTALGLLLSLRKRLASLRWLKFDIWRNAHVLLAALALAILFLHTGASLGDGINRWLILNFLVIALVGFGSALVASVEGHWVSTRIKGLKRLLVLCHILSVWPFPVLLGFHITSVYYF